MTQFTVNNDINVQHEGEVVYGKTITKGIMSHLRFQFCKFFEFGDSFKNMCDKLTNYNWKTENFCNFIQGSLWKQKVSSIKGKIVFPFFLYADDVEINNP